MATANYYIFTPCCGGHPVVLSQNSVIFPELPKVYKYVGDLPYVDSTGLYSLMPGQCYEVIILSGQIAFVLGLNPTPDIINFEETTYVSCEDRAIGDIKCDCPNVYQLTSCCTGETTLYNIVGVVKVVEGETYTVLFDPLDFTTLECFTFNSLSIEDPESVPTLDANLVLTSLPADCENTLCQLLCLPCICLDFTGTSGVYQVVTCDLQTGIIQGTVDGPVLIIESNPPVPVTNGICLRVWQEFASGLTLVNKGDCDIVYWNNEGSEINCPTYYKIVNCEDATEEICVSNDLSVLFASGAAITLAGQPNKCWRIEETNPCPQTYDINFTIIHENCEDCLEKNQVNYQLINCLDRETLVYTSSDLSSFVGSIVSLNEYPEDCWYVEVVGTTIPSDIEVTVNSVFTTCDLCTETQYLLEDCNLENPLPNIITNVDLSAYVGQVITLDYCPDVCWQVSETDPIPNPQLVNVIEFYNTCEDCLPTPPEPEPPVYKYKSVRPGYNTPGCTPEKYEQYMCNFSEAMYRQVMVDAYGIEPCCGDDDIKWQIKKELIELKAITDPDYNCIVGNNCDCTTSTTGLTPCVPTQPICHLYNIIVISFTGTSINFLNCQGEEQILLVPPGRFSVGFVVCGVAGQTINTPLDVQAFNYVETTTECTE